MYQQQKSSSDVRSSTQKHHVVEQPSDSAGFASSAGCPAGAEEPFKRCRGITPPLPGMEAYGVPSPLEFNNSPQSLTDTIDRILENSSKRDLNSLTYEQRQAVLNWEEENGLGVGACLNVFPSGEISGGCYSRGNKKAPGHTGKIKSVTFTKQARKKIRRAVDCRITSFKLFVTLTFDPKQSQRTESGSVDQEWAKERFKQFLNTLKKKYDRMADKTGKEKWRLSYIWVAEIQEKNTNNIHFHILVDRSFIDVTWLVKIWGQASNSVNVKRLNDQRHAVNYMLKYMKKGNCPIEGKRYGMTQNLIAGSKPVKYDFYGRYKRNAFLRIKDALEWQIKENRGYVADWGLSIPPPKREFFWKDKQGNTHQSKGTSRKIGQDLMTQISAAMTEYGEPMVYDESLAALVEVPF